MFTPQFLLSALIVALIPRSGVVFTTSIAAYRGKAYAMMAALGCALGILPHGLLAVGYLTLIYSLSSLAFQLVQYLGFACLLYFAWSIWKNIGVTKLQDWGVDQGLADIVVGGFVVNLVNFEIALFFMAFLPQFIIIGGSTADTAITMLTYCGVFSAMSLGVFALYGLFPDSRGDS